VYTISNPNTSKWRRWELGALPTPLAGAWIKGRGEEGRKRTEVKKQLFFEKL